MDGKIKRFVDNLVGGFVMWPAWFPDDCPPQDATDASGVVYRFVKTAILTEIDFQPHLLRFTGKDFDKPCLASGLSVFRTIDHVRKARSTIPGMRKKHVATGSLCASDGRLKDTSHGGDGHHTWWRPESCEALTLFAGVTLPEVD